MTRPLTLALVVIALAVVGVLLLYRPSEPTPATPESRPRLETPDPTPEPRTADVLPIGETPDDGPAFVQPDGTRLPPLNGLTESVVLEWPRSEPYSPVVGRRIEPNGVEWYVHEDGTRSTAHMVWRSDLGREAAATVLARPTEPLPMETAPPSGESSRSGR